MLNPATQAEERRLAEQRQAVLDEKKAAYTAVRQTALNAKQTRVAQLDQRLADIAAETHPLEELSRTRRGELAEALAITEHVTPATDPNELATMLSRQTALEKVIAKINVELERLAYSARVANQERGTLFREVQNEMERNARA